LVEDLATDLSVLESHMDGMLDRVQMNAVTLRRFQIFEMRLLKLNSLAEMIEHILSESAGFFDLDAVSFCLIDEKGELEGYLLEDGYNVKKKTGLVFLKNKELMKTTFGLSANPYLGRYKSSKCADFFAGVEKRLASVAIIPLTRRGKFLGSLNLGSFNPDRFTDTMATDFIEHMGTMVSVCLENNLNFEVLRRTSLVDTLTGVNNRRFLEQRLGEEIDRTQRNSEPLSCFFLDIDFFKKVNDTYGHQTGDKVLTVVAGTIRDQLRNNDVLARYGGEEFVALLSNIPENMALDIAERIRKTVKALQIESDGQALSITISIGVSTFCPEHDHSASSEKISVDLIHCADKALYDAKHSGRDCVVSGGVIPDLSKETVNSR
jgi:diguanylate cyclase (GGDEF)-like protein